jgi:hypothetical protein
VDPAHVTDRRAPLVWAALVVPTWLVLVLCTHWEPVLGDGWGHVEFHIYYPLSLDHLWFFAKYNYVSMNPRLGQTLTMLLFTPGPWHAIVTPLVELGMFYLLATLALGRWPSLRRLDDALLFATIVALVLVCTPVIGPMLFYRPFTGNYLYGLAISLAFLVPYRLHVEAPRAYRWWAALPMFLLGAAAGMSNEHTGPAFALAAITAIAYRRERPRAWMVAGVLGLIAGGLALYFAPGQDVRYSGLATQESLLGRIASRGFVGNARVFGAIAEYLLASLPWIGLAAVAGRGAEPPPRTRKLATLALAGAALLVAITLLASPKLGLRLLLASIALSCTAIASWVVPRLVSRWSRAVAWAFASVVLAFSAFRFVTIYEQVGSEFADRMAAIQQAPVAATIIVAPLSAAKSRWFYGDDFLLPSKRASVAELYGLAAIELNQRVTTPSGDEP